jgi:CRISPR type III-A-associated protein Csm2
MTIKITTVVQQDDPKLLVEEAQNLAGKLRADNASKSQLRRLYGTMKEIELRWPIGDDDQAMRRAYRDLLMLKPRLAYQTDRHKQLRELTTVLSEGIDAVGMDRTRLKRLSQFFEATLAYSIAPPLKSNQSRSHNQPHRQGGGKR